MFLTKRNPSNRVMAIKCTMVKPAIHPTEREQATKSGVEKREAPAIRNKECIRRRKTIWAMRDRGDLHHQFFQCKNQVTRAEQNNKSPQIP